MVKYLRYWMAIAMLAGGVARGDGWFGGLELGTVDHEFHPKYSFADGHPSRSFLNESDGREIGWVGGYTKSLGEHFFVDFQARAAWNDSQWEAYLANEPAWFEYKIEYNLGVSVLPRIRLHKYLDVFAELGVVCGYVTEEKQSPTATRSSYDATQWVPGYAWGGGVRSDITEKVSLVLEYREVKYAEFDYNARLPDGTLNSKIEDAPEAECVSLALIYRF